jgi:hypothetical protein
MSVADVAELRRPMVNAGRRAAEHLLDRLGSSCAVVKRSGNQLLTLAGALKNSRI